MDGKGTQEHSSHTTVGPAKSPAGRSPLRWMVSLAVAEWLPVAFMLTSLVLYRRLGLGNDDVTYYCSWLFLPWVFAPAIERLVPQSLNSRNAIVTMEVLTSLLTIALASSIASEAPTSTLNALFMLSGVCGVVHNVEAARLADRYSTRMTARTFTSLHAVAFFLAVTACHGLAVSFAGNMEVLTRNVRSSWRFTFYILAAVLAAIALLHCATLPSSDTEQNSAEQDHELQRADAEQNDNETQRPELCTRNLKQSLVVETLKSHSEALLTSACLMLFVLPEALVLPVSALFVIDARHNGGLGLSPAEYGFAWASVGMAAFVAGLLLGNGLTRQMRSGRWLWLMAVVTTAPNVAYLLLSHDMPTDLTIVTAHIVARQMLVGFGLALCLRGLAVGDGQTHRAAVRFRRVTIVALTMFVGGIYSGALQDYIGYRTFFGVAVATVACSLAAAFFQGVVKTPKTGLGC